MIAAPTRSRLSWSWSAGLACGIGLAVQPAMVVFLSVMLAPAAVAFCFDRHPDRSAARPILAAGVAFTISPLLHLWRDGVPSLGQALDLLSQPAAIAPAWLAGGGAWLMSEAMVFAALRVLSGRDRLRMRQIDAEIAALVAEWSLPDDPGATPD